MEIAIKDLLAKGAVWEVRSQKMTIIDRPQKMTIIDLSQTFEL